MRYIFLILGVLGSSIAHADEVDNLISLLGVEESIDKAVEECRAGSSQLLVEELRLETQSERLGIGRDHKLWLELAAIYEEFYSLSCEYASAEEAKNIWRQVYKSNLSDSEVKELISFYSRPLGKKVINLDLQANAKAQELISQRYAKYTYQAQRAFEVRMEEFLRKLELEQHNNAPQSDA